MERALIVSAMDSSPLAAILRAGGFEVKFAGDCESACRQLDASPPATVLISDLNLPDGNWCTLLRMLIDRDLDTKLLVCSRFAGRLRIVEVVQRGGEYSLARSYEAETLPGLAAAA
jgi:DNA-binding NtrC family response regulator